VGKKTAERLVVEMRDRLDQLAAFPGAVPATAPLAAPGGDRPGSEAVSALVALGYRPGEAERMVRAVETPELSSEELIRAALKAAAGA
jgi:Holliday junction DNA helicase RuvA